MPDDDLEKLRLMVLNRDPGDISFYPASLTLLSTVGPKHNFSPIAMTKTIPAIGDYKGATVPIFRFYFEGLVIHMHRQSVDAGETKARGAQVVGNENEIVFSTVKFEGSWQLENMRYIKAESLADERLPYTETWKY